MRTVWSAGEVSFLSTVKLRIQGKTDPRYFVIDRYTVLNQTSQKEPIFVLHIMFAVVHVACFAK